MMTEIFNKKYLLKRFSLIIILSSILLWSCVDSISVNDTLPPSITIYSPKINDTVTFGYLNINYNASDDQGIKSIELFIDSLFIQSFAVNSLTNLPTIAWKIDPKYVGKKITLVLKAVDLNGNFSFSNFITEVFVKIVLSSPYELILLKLNATSVNIQWKDSIKDFVKGYELWRKAGITAQYVKYKTLPANSFNTNDINLDQFTSYFYKIRSFNESNYSNYSNEVRSSDVGSSGNLNPPTDLTANVLSTSKIVLTWKDNNNNENFYKIERRTTTSSFQVIELLPYNSTNYKDSANGLSANTEYYYRIKTFSDTDSAWSNEVYAKTYQYDIEKPTNLVASNFNSVIIRLTWNDNTQFDKNTKIERRTGTTSFIHYATVGKDINQFDDSTTEIGINYTYRVIATDGNIYSEYSNESSITKMVNIPNPPSNLQGYFNFPDSAVYLSWSDNSNNEKGFIIERKDISGGNDFQVIGITLTNNSTFFDSYTQSGKNYSYRVKSTDGLYSSNYSNVINVLHP